MFVEAVFAILLLVGTLHFLGVFGNKPKATTDAGKAPPAATKPAKPSSSAKAAPEKPAPSKPAAETVRCDAAAPVAACCLPPRGCRPLFPHI